MSGEERSTLHGPRTTTTPTKPRASPTAELRLSRTAGSRSKPIRTVHRGVVAFQIPASTLEMCVCAQANRMKGTTLNEIPTTRM